MAFVFAREGALGRRLAGDCKSHRLSPFGSQQLSPFLVGFMDFAHEEQLISS
jgi:hypothetical protein